MAAGDRDGRQRRLAHILKRTVIVAAVILIAGAFAVAAFYRPPHGGGPFAVVEIPPPPKAKGDSEPSDLPMREALRPEDEPAMTEPDMASAGANADAGSEIDPLDVEIIDPSDMIAVDDAGARPGQRNIRLAAAPLEGFTETGEFGPLPRISGDGRTPATMYARPFRSSESRDAPVRIALLVTGLGISANGTREAINRLPGEVTLAFAPYGEGLQTWVNRARSNGHEIMLQVPMEPFDYPDNDPGPHTLLTSLKPDENIGRLRWLMSRFSGYFGITNYMGAKFTADDRGLLPVMTEISSRGLAFLDDGGSPRSRAVPVAIAENADAKKADIIIDAGQSREAIETALRRLEDIAKEQGSAIGVGSALPVTVETLAEWAQSLASRGIALAPVSALLAPAEG